jgi:hypothetical protein
LNSKPLETGRILAHIDIMPENRLERPRDANQLAKLIVDILQLARSMIVSQRQKSKVNTRLP